MSKFLLSICCCLSLFIQAQNTLTLDSIELVKHYSYELNNAGEQQLVMYKESQFDTSQIMIRQERWHYVYTDTGRAVSTHYLLEYNPKTRLGAYFTEQLPHKSTKATYKKELSNFKSFDHYEKRTWAKQYDANQKLLRETENSYNKQGELVKTHTRDYGYSPALLHREEVQRNNAGLMVLWESYDDDGGGAKKVREMSWDYLQDTILLRNVGYVYNDWNELSHSYNKKSGQLEKSVLTYGYRQDDGTIKRNHRTETFYKLGVKTKEVDYEYNKKMSTRSYSFSENSETEVLSIKGNADVVSVTQRSYDDANRLTQLLKTKADKPEYEEAYEFDENGLFIRYSETEYRSSGAHAKRITEYNEKGNPTRKLLYIGDKLSKVDEYEYVP